MRKYKITSLDKLSSVAKSMLKDFGMRKKIFFYGEMGVGKTTLIKHLIGELGVIETINSPTFSIVNEYLSDKKDTIYHFDFYRINDEEEALDMGIEDYFYSDNYCFVEWTENIPNLLPKDIIKVLVSLLDDGTREVVFDKK